MSTTVHTFALDGVSARHLRVSADVTPGLPAFTIVGQPDAAARESRERVRAALLACGFEFPLARITIRIWPARRRAAIPALDLAIVGALLGASGQVDLPGRIALVGEVRLDGTVPAITGTIPIAEAARDHEIDRLIVPAASAPEATLVAPAETVPLAGIAELPELAAGDWPPRATPARLVLDPPEGGPDLADLRGLPELRRALEVAAAGGHGLLMAGPRGAGMSLAAVRIPSILPPVSEAEALELARVASAVGRVSDGQLPTGRPFRAPHHAISEAGLLGGGVPTRLGEITLAPIAVSCSSTRSTSSGGAPSKPSVPPSITARLSSPVQARARDFPLASSSSPRANLRLRSRGRITGGARAPGRRSTGSRLG